MSVLGLLDERGLEGSKAETLGAMLWRVPGREFGKAMAVQCNLGRLCLVIVVASPGSLDGLNRAVSYTHAQRMSVPAEMPLQL